MRNTLLIVFALIPTFVFTQSIKSDSNSIDSMQTKEIIKLYDDNGNEYSYPRKEYGEKILPDQLKKAWDNPDNLYGVITTSLYDGFNKELIDAGIRLLSIDYDTSRAYTTLGIIYLKSNLLDKAEQTLLQGIKICNDKSYLKTNLAKVYDAQGHTEKSYNTLWESIELNPNNENAVVWIGAIHNEKGGKEEYLNIMMKISEIPSSWRAQLWIARDYLDKGESENAIKIYREILPRVTNEPDAMMQISGDLGKHGRSEDVMSMFYPLYNIDKQGYKTGLNIVVSCIETKNKAIGLKVLNDIKKLERYDLTSYLNRLENKLNQIKE